ncbi:MAG: ATP-binding protein [Aeromonadaceae bacterium]
MSTVFRKAIGSASKNSLSIQLLSYILACSTLLAVIITLLQLFWDYRQDVDQVESSLNQIESSFLQPIASSLWNLDEEQIQVQLEGIMNLPSMQFVEVREVMGSSAVHLLSLGKSLPQYDISREFELVYQGEKVGKLFVASSLEMIYHRLLEKSVLILITQTIKTLVVSFCILLIFYYKVVRHLNRIVNYTENFNPDEFSRPLELEGRSNNGNVSDELDLLARSINRMRLSLADEFAARQQVSERLKQERDFSTTLINSSNLLICCLDTNLQIVTVNPAAVLLTGYVQQELLGQSWLDRFVSPVERSRLFDELSQAGMLENREITTHDQQGEELILQWNFVPFYEGPELKYRIAFGYDITPLKRVEREIIRLNEELELKVDKRTRSLKESNEQLAKAYENLKMAQQTLVETEKMASLGSLVAGVAHEINTPVGISVTAASFLQERVKEFHTKLDEKQLSRSYLTELIHTLDESSTLLQNNLRRASDLISSFKQVAVDQSSQAHYRFNVADNLHQVVVSLGHKLKKSQSEVEIHCDPKLSVYSYPGSFAQIYSNLILNSINHGFEGLEQQKKIEIEIVQHENELVIDYRDNGRGIDPVILPRIFDPFVTSKRGQGGSGLGTHIVYNLVVQLMKGRISCDSEPGQGAHFQIRLPIEQDTAAQTA